MAEQLFYVDVNLNKNKLKGAAIESLASAPTSPVLGQLYVNTGDNFLYMWNGTAWVNLSQVLTGAATVKGEITNADTSPSFPSSPSSGDIWFVTTNAGTVGGQTVEVGDMLIYGEAGWFIVQRNVGDATESVKGLIELATQSEVNAGTDTSRAITPATLVGFLSNYLYAKKVITSITTLAANTATTVTHGLGLSNQNGLIVMCWQANALVGLAIASTSTNAITVTSNQALSNVIVVCQG